MERNPYSPPVSAVGTASREGGPRPFAVWLFVVVLALLTLADVVGLTRVFSAVASHGFEVRNPHLAQILAWRLAWLVVGSFATVSTYRRGIWGRWLGVAAIVAVALWAVLRPQPSQYPDMSYEVGALFGQYFMSPLLCAWWAYSFGFSPKAKRYFLIST